jgi:glycosyltransferase involved in cell wall biosynthesis
MLISFAEAIQFSTILSVCGLLFYYLFFYKKLADYKPQVRNITPAISVIICAKNELSNLKLFLPAVLNQDYPDYEVVVVLDHCNDKSEQHLIEVAKTYPELKVFLFEKDKRSGGKKEALAFGISKASNEHLLMTDADCCPASSLWIAEMAKGFSNSHELVLGISTYEQGINQLLSKIIRWDSLLIAIQYLSYSLKDKTYMSVGRNVAYTKKLFSSVNGFESHLSISSGDDDLFVQEIQSKGTTSIVITQESHTHSPSPKTWKKFLNQKSRHFSTSSKYNLSTLILLGFYQLFIILFYASTIASLLTMSNLATLLTVFLIKNLVQANVFRRIFFKIGVRVQLLPFLFFDIIWVMLLTIVNIKRIFSPNTKW